MDHLLSKEKVQGSPELVNDQIWQMSIEVKSVCEVLEERSSRRMDL